MQGQKLPIYNVSSQLCDNTLLGTVLTKSITFNIEIRSIDKPVPADEIENLKEWVKHKAVELGSGLQHEYYGYTDDYKDDIGIGFYVYSA